MGLPLPAKILLRYARRVLIATDQWLNVLTGGEPGETISYRAAQARLHRKAWGCVFCRLLDRFERDHCGLTLRRYDTNRTIGS